MLFKSEYLARDHFLVAFWLSFKTSLYANLSRQNEFDFHESKLAAGGTHFHFKWFHTKTRLDSEAIGGSEMAQETSNRIVTNSRRLYQTIC